MSIRLSLHFLPSGEKHVMQEDEMTVGKSDRCTLQLSKKHFHHPVDTISRCHFKISKVKDGFVLTDLLSRNGTKINDSKLIPNHPYFLRDGDIIALAKKQKFKLKVAVRLSSSKQKPSSAMDTMLDESAPVKPKSKESAPEPVRSNFYFDEATERFVVDAQPIAITGFTELEHDLLRYLYDNAERLCLYHDLIEHVWGGWVSSNNIISSAVGRIRRKLDRVSNGAGKRYIKTKTGFGYMLTVEQAE